MAGSIHWAGFSCLLLVLSSLLLVSAEESNEENTEVEMDPELFEFFKDVEEGHIRRLSHAVENGDIDVDEKRPSDGNTALHIACAKGHQELVQFLLDEGADVNVQNSVGETPLHLAVLHQHPAIVHVLLKYGPDISLSSDVGGSPLLYAASSEQTDVLKLLKQYMIARHMSNSPGSVDARKKAQQTGNSRLKKDEL